MIDNALTVSLPRARALFLAAQGLLHTERDNLATPGLTPGDASAAIARTVESYGFLRTLGGIEVYLALRARLPGMRRSQLDEAKEMAAVQVVPAVRGCM